MPESFVETIKDAGAGSHVRRIRRVCSNGGDGLSMTISGDFLNESKDGRAPEALQTDTIVAPPTM